jgi:hypothetical protein
VTAIFLVVETFGEEMIIGLQDLLGSFFEIFAEVLEPAANCKLPYAQGDDTLIFPTPLSGYPDGGRETLSQQQQVEATRDEGPQEGIQLSQHQAANQARQARGARLSQ